MESTECFAKSGFRFRLLLLNRVGDSCDAVDRKMGGKRIAKRGGGEGKHEDGVTGSGS